MTAALIAYALIGAIVLGWLLHQHLSSRYRHERVPLHILVLMAILWGPVLLGFILLACAWTVQLLWMRRVGW